MARKPRLHYPGAFYHVMLRGNGGQEIFFSEDDRHHFGRGVFGRGVEPNQSPVISKESHGFYLIWGLKPAILSPKKQKGVGWGWAELTI